MHLPLQNAIDVVDEARSLVLWVESQALKSCQLREVYGDLNLCWLKSLEISVVAISYQITAHIYGGLVKLGGMDTFHR